jgi:hypothetical protein
VPIALHQYGVAAPANPGYADAKELARQCVEQYEFNVLPGPGGGIAGGSCWAAVAVTANAGAGYPAAAAVNAAGGLGAVGAPLPYAIAFGNSQLAHVAVHVPVPGLAAAPGGHAERNALTTAGAAGLALYALPAVANNGVMFVQLMPCAAGPNCQNWLQGIVGGGPANPYAALLGAGGVFTLNVWYRWAHPGGTAAMTAWNGGGRAAKLANIGAW